MMLRLAAALASTLFTTTIATAEPIPDRRFHLDVEVDPTAYVLEGYSLHVGLGWGRLRLDVGAFGMAVPSFAVGNSDFDVSFDGYGAKLQYFPFAEQRGGFVGLDGGVAWQLAERTATEMASRDRQVSLGVNAGWRFAFGDRFYATPWLGVSHAFSARDTTLAGSTYQPPRITFFPAIHLGVRFQ